eukprot:s3881_g1.t2
MQPRQPPAAALRLAMLRICQQNGVAYAETAALDGLSGAASCFLQDILCHAELASRSKVVRTDAMEAARGVRLGKDLQGVPEDEEESAGWVRPGNLAAENSGSSGAGNAWCSQSQEFQGEELEAKPALRRKRPRIVADSETSRFTSLCETMQSGKQCGLCGVCARQKDSQTLAVRGGRVLVCLMVYIYRKYMIPVCDGELIHVATQHFWSNYWFGF